MLKFKTSFIMVIFFLFVIVVSNVQADEKEEYEILAQNEYGKLIFDSDKIYLENSDKKKILLDNFNGKNIFLYKSIILSIDYEFNSTTLYDIIINKSYQVGKYDKDASFWKEGCTQEAPGDCVDWPFAAIPLDIVNHDYFSEKSILKIDLGSNNDPMVKDYLIFNLEKLEEYVRKNSDSLAGDYAEDLIWDDERNFSFQTTVYDYSQNPPLIHIDGLKDLYWTNKNTIHFVAVEPEMKGSHPLENGKKELKIYELSIDLQTQTEIGEVKNGKKIYYSGKAPEKIELKSVKSLLPGNPNQPFVDIGSEDPLYQVTKQAHQKNYISGYSDGTFKPDNLVNRAEFAKMLILAFEKPYQESLTQIPTNLQQFPDIENHWYLPFLSEAVDLKLMQGYPDSTIKPDNTIIQAEAIKMTIKALDPTLVTTTEEINTSANWHQPYIDFALNNLDLSFLTQDSIAKELSRGEAVELIEALLEYEEQSLAISNSASNANFSWSLDKMFPRMNLLSLKTSLRELTMAVSD